MANRNETPAQYAVRKHKEFIKSLKNVADSAETVHFLKTIAEERAREMPDLQFEPEWTGTEGLDVANLLKRIWIEWSGDPSAAAEIFK